jgi:hypothetical protein
VLPGFASLKVFGAWNWAENFEASHAEDTYNELSDAVSEMLLKTIYGFMSVDVYRTHLRAEALNKAD